MNAITTSSAPSGSVERDDARLLKMLEDALSLARYAAELGNLPPGISVGELYRMRYQIAAPSTPLSTSDINQLGTIFALLQDALAPVTAASLAATECHNSFDCMDNQAGRHVRRLWYWSFSAVALIAVLNLVQYYYNFYVTDWVVTWPEGFVVLNLVYLVSLYISPFTYGALGAGVHILRVTEKHLRLRTFDVRRITQHRNRLVLGTLSGGVIVLFVTTGSAADTTTKLTGAAAGFMAGYSVDFLFAILDRILAAVVPQNTQEKLVDKSTQQERKVKMHIPAGMSPAQDIPASVARVDFDRPAGETLPGRPKATLRSHSPEIQAS